MRAAVLAESANMKAEVLVERSLPRMHEYVNTQIVPN